MAPPTLRVHNTAVELFKCIPPLRLCVCFCTKAPHGAVPGVPRRHPPDALGQRHELLGGAGGDPGEPPGHDGEVVPKRGVPRHVPRCEMQCRLR